jgi:hypothetical protein
MDKTSDSDYEAFRRELPALLADPANRGRFALLHAGAVAGLYPTFEAALAAGYDRFELDPFLVQEVTDRREPVYFPRVLKCRT